LKRFTALCKAASKAMMALVAICFPYGVGYALHLLTQRFPDFFATQVGDAVISVAFLANIFVFTPVSIIFLVWLVARREVDSDFGPMGV